MKYKTEMEDLDRKFVEYTNNDTSFQITSAYLLELASKAKNIFERSQPEQKNKILRMLLANPTLKAKRLQLPLLKPFASVLDNSISQNWLSLQVTNLLNYFDIEAYSKTLRSAECSESLNSDGFMYRISSASFPASVGNVSGTTSNMRRNCHTFA